ncbi:MAG: hypothetical protein COT22_07500 [Ignavibacteria bacterium CG08_land_8_20_14_0_20_37_9]|nr:MAG: hypothetical protein AUJ54_11520 [Ignavibacteria bacterium CG1_02_37_35]PIS45007.1 MAG: hypothetical protein COT22_07500 [Ignavibacteria bacterium CG08_land_8_20_14_0_20_37_9]PIX93173.1 MAG: hypothetical protein COZ25_12095 [Ignavibacteria bacterium CG_4_10_14_3_um_filter_37_18]PJC60486.1 MAG: hypothetical protein CO025_03060 [Ignavibacteria bacterium CG_4_9_14_0_2_um_filter_37_13]
MPMRFWQKSNFMVKSVQWIRHSICFFAQNPILTEIKIMDSQILLRKTRKDASLLTIAEIFTFDI